MFRRTTFEYAKTCSRFPVCYEFDVVTLLSRLNQYNKPIRPEPKTAYNNRNPLSHRFLAVISIEMASQDLRASASVPARSSAVGILNSILGQRNQDYVSDAPQSYPSMSFGGPNNTSNNNSYSRGGTSAAFTTADTLPAPPTPDPEASRGRFSLSYNQQLRLWYMLHHPFWEAGMILFSFLLLFGAQLRQLCLPKTMDLTCDVVFLIAFVVLLLDVVFRSVAVPEYFQCSCFTKGGDQQQRRRGCFGRNINRNSKDRPSEFQFGSFLFWCDLLSTLMLLREISFTNLEGSFQEQEVKVNLDAWDMPVRVSSATLETQSLKRLDLAHSFVLSLSLCFLYPAHWAQSCECRITN